jgi:hypothetical protein
MSEHALVRQERELLEANAAIVLLVEALRQAQKLCDVALPQFNWKESALNSDALLLLNDVPSTIQIALAPYAIQSVEALS